MENGKFKVKSKKSDRAAKKVTFVHAGLYRVVNAVPIGIPEGGTTVDIERQTLSIMKACEIVGVSRRTIYNWMAGGKVQYVRTAGESVRIFADSLWRAPQEQRDNPQIQH